MKSIEDAGKVFRVIFPDCPHLPTARPDLDWRALNVYRTDDRGEAFYFACLEYGHALWLRGLPSRALLCIDRAFGADLTGGEAILEKWPMPYEATAFILGCTPAGEFVGNPRVHFQHYADRVNEPRRDQRRWRAWACWALTRIVLPELPGDPKHPVEEPSFDEIFSRLSRHGLPGEAELWKTHAASAAARPPRPSPP